MGIDFFDLFFSFLFALLAFLLFTIGFMVGKFGSRSSPAAEEMRSRSSPAAEEMPIAPVMCYKLPGNRVEVHLAMDCWHLKDKEETTHPFKVCSDCVKKIKKKKNS